MRDALEEQRKGSAGEALALHQAEQWRDDLIADEEALAQWLGAYPGTDTQQLRALIRQARKDVQPDADASPRAWRRARAAPTAKSSSWCGNSSDARRRAIAA